MENFGWAIAWRQSKQERGSKDPHMMKKIYCNVNNISDDLQELMRIETHVLVAKVKDNDSLDFFNILTLPLL